MAEENILNLMLNHHALLGALLTLFKEELKTRGTMAKSSLAELKWETQKHFFSEENAIFDFVQMENYGVLEMINQLKDEHIAMLNILNRFLNNIDAITDEEVEKFSNLLESHREIEEQKLYPKLDKELPYDQKMQIISRVNEIPLTK